MSKLFLLQHILIISCYSVTIRDIFSLVKHNGPLDTFLEPPSKLHHRHFVASCYYNFF
uniref:Uncharacterized protein n=1 Tax=Kalanchoe fedtschenkoi TaxID=63787 RepID=A0A7N0V8L8_KALFE